MVRNPLYAFFLKAALWLPLCLGLWYWKAEWFNSPAAIMSGWIMKGLFPGWVEAVEWAQRTVSVVTTLEIAMVPGMKEGQHATMVAEANPLSYSFGLPFFSALLLASREAKRWRKLMVGALFLVPFQAWGICFDLLKQVAISAGPAVAAQTGFSTWQREGIAMSYQFGHLIMPTVAPIALWLALNRQFIPMLMLEGALQHGKDPGRQG